LVAPTAPATGYGPIVTRDMVWVLLHSGFAVGAAAVAVRSSRAERTYVGVRAREQVGECERSLDTDVLVANSELLILARRAGTCSDHGGEVRATRRKTRCIETRRTENGIPVPARLR
jgi:hypothetical protein